MCDKRTVNVMHRQYAHHACRLVDAVPSVNHLAIDEEILLKQDNALGLARCTAGIHNQTFVPPHVQTVVWPWCWFARSNGAIEFWIIVVGIHHNDGRIHARCSHALNIVGATEYDRWRALLENVANALIVLRHVEWDGTCSEIPACEVGKDGIGVIVTGNGNTMTTFHAVLRQQCRETT